MAQTIQIKRGTRAQLDAAASGAALKVGEPYLITDENRLAFGLTTSTYAEAALQDEVPVLSTDNTVSGLKIAVVADLPASPNASTLYIVTG